MLGSERQRGGGRLIERHRRRECQRERQYQRHKVRDGLSFAQSRRRLHWQDEARSWARARANIQWRAALRCSEKANWEMAEKTWSDWWHLMLRGKMYAPLRLRVEGMNSVR
jgi:hypothetical protein